MWFLRSFSEPSWQLSHRKGSFQYLSAPGWGNFARVVVRLAKHEKNDVRGEGNAALIGSAPALLIYSIGTLEWVYNMPHKPYEDPWAVRRLAETVLRFQETPLPYMLDERSKGWDTRDVVAAALASVGSSNLANLQGEFICKEVIARITAVLLTGTPHSDELMQLSLKWEERRMMWSKRGPRHDNA